MSLLCLLAYASFDDNILVRVLFGEQFSLTGLNCLSYSCVFIPDVFFTSVWTMTKFFLCFFEGFHGFPIKKIHIQLSQDEESPTTPETHAVLRGRSHYARLYRWDFPFRSLQGVALRLRSSGCDAQDECEAQTAWWMVQVVLLPYGCFYSHGGTPIAGWFILWKIRSINGW